jgi:hypothetical protein
MKLQHLLRPIRTKKLDKSYFSPFMNNYLSFYRQGDFHLQSSFSLVEVLIESLYLFFIIIISLSIF